MRKLDGKLSPDALPPPGEPLARTLALEAELHTTRTLLAARDEALQTLLGRLVEAERLVHQQAQALRVCETHHGRLEIERDHALALASGLQQLGLFRYTQAPRALYGFLRRLIGRG